MEKKILEMEQIVEGNQKLMEEDKETFKWRSWCKNVAYVDLVLISMGLPAGIICVVMGVNAGLPIQQPGMDEELSKESLESIKKLALVIAITVLVSMSGIGIWAAIKLMNATEFGRDPREAIQMARFWKNVNIVFISMALLGMIITQTFLSCGVNILWHSMLLYIVCQYINELEETVVAANPTKAGMAEICQEFEEPDSIVIVNRCDAV